MPHRRYLKVAETTQPNQSSIDPALVSLVVPPMVAEQDHVALHSDLTEAHGLCHVHAC